MPISLPSLILSLAVLSLAIWIIGIVLQVANKLIHLALAVAIVLFLVRLAMAYLG